MREAFILCARVCWPAHALTSSVALGEVCEVVVNVVLGGGVAQPAQEQLDAIHTHLSTHHRTNTSSSSKSQTNKLTDRQTGSKGAKQSAGQWIRQLTGESVSRESRLIVWLFG